MRKSTEITNPSKECMLLAFVHIEKCGGTTLDMILEQSFGIRHIDVIPKDKNQMALSNLDIQRLKSLRPRILSISGHAVRPWVLRNSSGSFWMYTLLRDPLKRYISDFKHFAPCYQAAGDFGRWLKLEHRHNFISRSLCGEANLDKAKEVLINEMKLVGVVELFDEFVSQLSVLARPFHLITDYTVQNNSDNRYSGGLKLYARFVRKMNLTRGVDIKNHANGIDFTKYTEDIKAVNRLDIKLYDFVLSELLPLQREKFRPSMETCQQNVSSLKAKWNLRANFLYRNLLYKPMQGYCPFWPHALPEYRTVFL